MSEENKNQEEENKKRELETRIRAFNLDLGPLLDKYKLGLGAQATILQDGRISARPIVVDATNMKKEPEVKPAE